MRETWVRSLGWEVPWRRKWQPTPGSCLENPMDREAWWPWGRKESDTTERLHFHFSQYFKNLINVVNYKCCHYGFILHFSDYEQVGFFFLKMSHLHFFFRKCDVLGQVFFVFFLLFVRISLFWILIFFVR